MPASKQTKSEERREGLLERWDALAVGCLITAAVSYAQFQIPFTRDFDKEQALLLYTYPVSVPFISVGLYLLLVHVVRPWFIKNVHPDSKRKSKDEPPSASAVRYDNAIKPVLRVWNLALALFSLMCLLGAGVPLVWQHVRAYRRGGFKYMYCDPDEERWHGPKFFWMWAFTLSKVAELVDTVFLVLRNKPVMFLHWYHHTTVLLFTWYANSWRFSTGWWFGIVNAFVHTVMYWYYYRRACGVKLSYDKLITKIQLGQMGLGIAIVGLWTYFWYTDPATCNCKGYEDKASWVVISAAAMYASYFVLFLMFYINRYSKKRAAAAAAAAAKKAH